MTIAKSLLPFGTTIFTEMTQLAVQHNAVNLSQGFPDFDGPNFVKQAAIQAINNGDNQYERLFGTKELTEALANHWSTLTGQNLNSDRNIQVTAGCTEAIIAVTLGLLNPGDEVILFEPYYDSYRPAVAMAGALPRFVTLRAPDFSFDIEELINAISPGKTRLIFINTPHNPTGKVFSRTELEQIAALCIKHDIIAVCDEVYEHLIFDGNQHTRMATIPGMSDRTITLSSLGKTFSLTGWKIGWAIGPENLIKGVRAAHQFITFAVATPLQHAAAVAINGIHEYLPTFINEYTERRDYLCNALENIGFSLTKPQGTYFILADHTPFGFHDDIEFCKYLTTEIGVAAIPPTAFYENKQHGKNLVRFAFCKNMNTLREAVHRLHRLQPK